MQHNSAWSPRALAAGIVVVALLVFSWFGSPLRPAWDALDEAVFYALNGTLQSGDGWRLVWAAANTRLFDLFTAILFAAVYLAFIVNGGWSQCASRTAGGVFLAVYTVLVLDVSSNYIYTFGRDSPRLVLEPAYRISDMISSVKVKDTSGSSFPGDHGTAVLLFTTLIWFFCGRRYGFVAAGIALVAIWPRMVGGAHWATDLLVGSTSIALTAGLLALATPLATSLAGAIERLLQRGLNWLHGMGWVPVQATTQPRSVATLQK
jgi:Kdo2-lipid A phosphotransferase